MSKGRRLREQRRREQQVARGADHAAELMTAILELETAEDFIALVESEPSLLDGTVVAHIEGMREIPGFDGIPKAAIELLRRAAERMALEDAWEAYQDRVEELERIATSLEGSDAELERASAEGRHEDALRIIEGALPRAKEAGLGILYCLLQLQKAKSLLAMETGDRAENLEIAIACAEEALKLQPGPEAEADAGMTLGLIWMERLRGDPRENVEVAIGVMGKALGIAEETGDRNLVAIIENNLANAFDHREEGERVENLLAARRACESALKWRSPDRDVVDWAHTQLTLGVVMEHLAEHGRAAYEQVEAVLAEIPAQQERGLPNWIVGRAHAAIGGLLRRRAESLTSIDRLSERIDEHEGEGPPEEGWITADDQAQAVELYKRAAQRFERALNLADDDARPFDYARLCRDLAAVLDELGEPEAALDAALDGLKGVGPESAPRLCRALGSTAGSLLAAASRWDEATAAYSQALEAGELLFHGRLMTADREYEQVSIGNLGRWTAHALARCGQLERSAEVLEAARARELRRRLAVDPAEELPDEIATVYRDAAAMLRASPLGEDSHEAAENLQRIVSEIRQIPGFERFDMGPSWQEITAAAEPGWPLVYINPAPQGVQFLIICRKGGQPTVSGFFFDETDSQEMILKLMADDPDHPESTASFFFTIGTEPRVDQIERALAYVLPWFGERIARPLLEAVEDADCDGLSVVPCGPLALVPIHACTWGEADGTVRSLIDELAVRYTPSATVLTGCRSAADCHSQAHPRFRLLGNPTPDAPLPASEAEVLEIAEVVGKDASSVAVGRAATRVFLAAGSDTSHVHFACHAAASVTDLDETIVLLSDGPLRATELG